MKGKWYGKIGVLLLAFSLITACNMDNDDNGDLNEGPLNQEEDQDQNNNNNNNNNNDDGERGLNDELNDDLNENDNNNNDNNNNNNNAP
ncbi:MAG TPA: hypothetical protein VF095_03650 [Bacillota bacterium]